MFLFQIALFNYFWRSWCFLPRTLWTCKWIFKQILGMGRGRWWSLQQVKVLFFQLIIFTSQILHHDAIGQYISPSLLPKILQQHKCWFSSLFIYKHTLSLINSFTWDIFPYHWCLNNEVSSSVAWGQVGKLLLKPCLPIILGYQPSNWS